MVQLTAVVLARLLPSKSVLTPTEQAHLQRLFEMHNKTDADGVPIWYVRRSLEDAIKELTTSISQQTSLLASIQGREKETSLVLKELLGVIKEMRNST